MKILAFDLSTARGSLAWLGDGEREQHWPNDRKNSGEFFERLQSLVREHGSPERIVVGLGPGSYAGTRIAISSAIGLAASWKAELVGLPSVCALEIGPGDYVAIGDARRQSFSFFRINDRQIADGPHLWDEETLRGKLRELGGQIPVFTSEKLAQFESVELAYPSALVLARLAREDNGNFSRPPLEPMYLREPHITIPKDKAKLAVD